MKCRHCQSLLSHSFLDLGSAPPSNAYLTSAQLNAPETWFPLRVLYCNRCWLVQTEDFTDRAALFTDDYAYFSSMSSTWLEHARAYAHEMIARFSLGSHSKVVEIASNDGYLLRNFQAAGIPCLGVEPTAACAAAARDIGIETVAEFFGADLAHRLHAQGHAADLMAANNVLAHVPDINDFLRGFAILLKPDGVASFEFPHLLRLVQGKQFDTVYHEHFSYLGLNAVQRIFAVNGLRVFDVQSLPTHGGSLRVFACRNECPRHDPTPSLAAFLEEERAAGMLNDAFYQGFQAQAEKIKDDFLRFLLDARREGKAVAAYGAAAKGSTLINFAGVRGDLISFVVDKSPMKVGRFLPGSRIPIVPEERIWQTRPDYVIILPWNIIDEVREQLAGINAWGGKFVVAVPEMGVLE